MIEAILQAKLRKIEKIRKRRENKFIRRAHCALSLRLAKDSSKKSDQPICKTYIFSANFKFVLSFKFGKIFALRSAIHPRSCLGISPRVVLVSSQKGQMDHECKKRMTSKSVKLYGRGGGYTVTNCSAVPQLAAGPRNERCAKIINDFFFNLACQKGFHLRIILIHFKANFELLQLYE